MICMKCSSRLIRIMFELNGVIYSFYFCEFCGKGTPVIRMEENQTEKRCVVAKRWRRKKRKARKQARKHECLVIKEKLSGIEKDSHKHDWKREIKISQDCICPVCGKRCNDRTMNIHHMRPKCKKGSNSKENTVGWCVECHRNYHKKHGVKISDRYGNPL